MKTDSKLQTEIMNALKTAPDINEALIGVFVREGIVTLTGQVPEHSEKAAAEKIAERIKGIKAVVEQIEVRRTDDYSRDDHAIAVAAVQALDFSNRVPKGVKVEVEKGWIKLTGSAEWEYEKEAATEAVGSLFGVAGVSNFMELKTKVKPDEVKNRIEQKLKELAAEEASQIKVFARGGRVILSGTVRTFSERHNVEQAAWEAPGVTEVRSELRVAIFG